MDPIAATVPPPATGLADFIGKLGVIACVVALALAMYVFAPLCAFVIGVRLVHVLPASEVAAIAAGGGAIVALLVPRVLDMRAK